MTIKAEFDFFSRSSEQTLLQDLVTESIQCIGADFYYLPRRLKNFDHLYGSDNMSEFDTAYTLEMYLENYAGFNGDQSFMGKFGIEIRDQVFFTISYERFKEEIGLPEGFSRPREGDLIYFTLNKKCFQIMYVDNKPSFYPLGALPMFKVTCELMEFSNERFSTGIPEIDLLNQYTLNVYQDCYTDNDGIPFTDEADNVLMLDDYSILEKNPIADNDEVIKETNIFVDFSERNPWGDLP
jgi:hypothetical protein